MSPHEGVKVGDVIFQEKEVAGLPYPTGAWVLCELGSSSASVALVSCDRNGPYAIDNRYPISIEDLGAFSLTGETARLTKF